MAMNRVKIVKSSDLSQAERDINTFFEWCDTNAFRVSNTKYSIRDDGTVVTFMQYYRKDNE